jgi:glycogen debranching enzyme
MTAGGSVSVLEGSTFVVSDRTGDIDASPTATQGLFEFDTRMLSRWVLTVNGQHPVSLSTDDVAYFEAQFFLVLPTGTIYRDSDVSIIRKRAAGDGFNEVITIENHAPTAITLEVRIDAGSDFADLFEIKDALTKKGEHYQRVEQGRLVLGYRREKFVRETWIDCPGATIDDRGLSFHVTLDGHKSWTTTIQVIGAIDGSLIPHATTKYHQPGEKARPNVGMDLDTWIAQAPKLVSSWPPLERTYNRSIIDLAALRFSTRLHPDEAVPAAGLPWFMTMFGRDSIFTSYQALPFVPELARATLRVLAARQGTTVDPFRDEEPGKIMHESRSGEMTAFEERPQSPYYGSADSTTLFVILLDEYERWTGDLAFVRELELASRAALGWIDAFGDRDGDGFIEYQRGNDETGLDNQCWKDSWNSISFHDGTVAQLPRATCELQGYAYDAKVRGARLARIAWNDPAFADRLEREAAALKARFNEEFWISGRDFYALALDGNKRKVDSLTSNIGHLLWSGIVTDERAPIVAAQLLSDQLFSGWGIRTMATGEGAYNPIGYHVGTVWPFDTSIVAEGLRRYGFRQEATRIAMGILDASPYFNYRLPEAFAGYPRAETGFPVEYPTSCSPQAWSTAAPLLLLRTILGLDAVGEHLLTDPAIPVGVGRIELLGIPGRWGRADAFGRDVLQMEETPAQAAYARV